MPRPSRNLTRISVYLPTNTLAGLDAEAEQIAGTRSDVIRLAVENYLKAVEDYLKGEPRDAVSETPPSRSL